MTSKVVCIDANFIIRLVNGGTIAVPFKNLWIQWYNDGLTPVAPALIHYEVCNSFHRLSLAGQILPEEANEALSEALNLNIRLYDDVGLHRAALDLAKRLKLSATYDAHYLALAQRLQCEFWTTDKRLVNAVVATLPWVKLVT